MSERIAHSITASLLCSCRRAIRCQTHPTHTLQTTMHRLSVHSRVIVAGATRRAVATDSSVWSSAARSATAAARRHHQSHTQARMIDAATRCIATTARRSTAQSAADLESEFADLWSDVSSSSSGAVDAPSASSSEAQLQQSTGDVVGVTGGIVSIDGLKSAHVGACVEFIDQEQVRTRRRRMRTKESKRLPLAAWPA